jgi:hypothetical protein
MKILLLAFCFVLLASCTQIRYNVDSHEIKYLSLLQKKTLNVSVVYDPISGKENVNVAFSTNSDPAVQMFQAALAAAAQAAVLYGGGIPVAPLTPLRQPSISDDLPSLPKN